jgi:hypothetical protein
MSDSASPLSQPGLWQYPHGGRGTWKASQSIL